MLKKIKSALSRKKKFLKKIEVDSSETKVEGAVLETPKESRKGKIFKVRELIGAPPALYKFVNFVNTKVGYNACAFPEILFIVTASNYNYDQTTGGYRDVLITLIMKNKDCNNNLIAQLMPFYVDEDSTLECVEELKDSDEELLKKFIFQVGERTYQVGSDPEIFVKDKDGKIVPAFTFLPEKPSSKNKEARKDPENLPAYWDGFQAEFETCPQYCLAYHVDYIQYGLKKVLNAAREKDPTAKLSIKTVMDIPLEFLQTASDEHVEFGCMPSLNAYGMRGLGTSGRDTLFRPAGGHIHFGVGNNRTQEQAAKAVKALDAILGVCCVSMFAGFDDPRRRSLYGLAGEFRMPAHGIEYRTLSNAWLCHPVVTHLVFDLARRAFNLGFYGLFDKLDWKCSEQETIRIINQCDVEAARKVMQENKDILMRIFERQYNLNKDKSFAAYKSFYEGIESIIVDPKDIENNWNMNKTWLTHSNGTNKYFNSAVSLIMLGKKVA